MCPQLSAAKIAGAINARATEHASLEKLLARIKSQLENLAPLST
jgi:hypothetical protein